ncbi:restriction endonuclease subunit S [Nibribacter koreensis]|uniref:Restriction endonuclease subunit S n=1 Tax=Nibribacter koreensis TaxID=1084519 RepID=A0ABP8F7D4_9BACT
MKYLEKLLEGVEVDWQPLGEITDYEQPTKYLVTSKNYNADFQTPVLTAGKTFILGYTDETDGIYKASEKPVIIFDDFTTANKWVDFDFKAKSSAMKMITSKDESKALLKYIYYWLSALPSGLVDGDHKRQWISNYCNKLIPIPPLHIQKEIVRILSAFTELTALLITELSAELTARKKQYNYYREQLLNFNEGEVEYLPMGHESLGKFIRGGGLQKKDFTETGVGCIHYGQIYTYYGTYTDKTKTFVSAEFAKKARMAKYGDLIIATTSENDEDVCKSVAWLGAEGIAVSSDACFYTHNLNPKYVAYFFQTEQFQKQKRPFITGSKVRRVNADDLAKIKIPIPLPEEQERIVSILDKFSILTKSISEGIPKEIKLRKKQYEYYRDLLLTFPKNNIES